MAYMCGVCHREILTAKETRSHQRHHYLMVGLALFVAALVGGVLTFVVTEYATVKKRLVVAERHLTEWQKIKMVDALVDETLRLKKRRLPTSQEVPYPKPGEVR